MATVCQGLSVGGWPQGVIGVCYQCLHPPSLPAEAERSGMPSVESLVALNLPVIPPTEDGGATASATAAMVAQELRAGEVVSERPTEGGSPRKGRSRPRKARLGQQWSHSRLVTRFRRCQQSWWPRSGKESTWTWRSCCEIILRPSAAELATSPQPARGAITPIDGRCPIFCHGCSVSGSMPALLPPTSLIRSASCWLIRPS